MPPVATEGQLHFVVNTRENAFEPPHVHIWVGNENVCRIELNGGSYMDEPPPGIIETSCRRTPSTPQQSGKRGTGYTGDRLWTRHW